MEKETVKSYPNIYQRVVDTLGGQKPDKFAFIDRLELWYSCHSRSGTLPKKYLSENRNPSSKVLSLQEFPSLTSIHQLVGIGQLKYVNTHKIKLREVEIIAKLDGKIFYHEQDPIIDHFPRYGIVQADKPGVSVTEIISSVGKLVVQHEVVSDMIVTGTVPYMKEHPIKDLSDVKVLKYIFDRVEYIPQNEIILEEQEQIGNIGFVVPALPRIPFQRMMLDFIGEIPLFYLLYDDKTVIQNMMELLDEHMIYILNDIESFKWPYVQFQDNIESQITNPKLFSKYCLPYYQRYADIVHGQNKKIGSHMDGNIAPLLSLVAESGLDVCESFSPSPLTQCTFEQAWHAWQNGPIIWGGIPSPILELRTSEDEFISYVDQILKTVRDKPIIFGIGDLVLGNNLIERVSYIADRIEQHDI